MKFSIKFIFIFLNSKSLSLFIKESPADECNGSKFPAFNKTYSDLSTDMAPILISLSIDGNPNILSYNFAKMIDFSTTLKSSNVCTKEDTGSTSSNSDCRIHNSLAISSIKTLSLIPDKNAFRWKALGLKLLKPICGQDILCKQGHDKVIILLQNPYNLVWQEVKNKYKRFGDHHKSLAFLTAPEVRDIQKIILDTSETIKKNWMTYINPILTGIRQVSDK
jgi:hypothetical protein